MRLAARRSALLRKIVVSDNTYLDSITTYMLKLGADHLPPGFDSPVDRKVAAAPHLAHLRLRMQQIARLLAEALITPLADAPEAPLHFVNIAGGPAFDSINALIMLARAHPALIQSKGFSERPVFVRHIAPLRRKKWHVCAKPPFARPEAVLAYLGRYMHRVAISNRRLIAFDADGVTLHYKDYRRTGWPDRRQVMTLHPHEFMRRFLLHVLPRGFHRIRHYGLLASGAGKASIARARELLAAAPPAEPVEPVEQPDPRPLCPLLRRTHAHHRDLRALEPTPCAAASVHVNRGGAVVTWQV